MASPLHRHQSSLQTVLEFPSPTTPGPNQLRQATEVFNQILSRCEPSQADSRRYKYVTLLRTVHDSIISKADFLHHFFLFIGAELRREQDALELNFSQALSRFDDLNSWDEEQLNDLERGLATFSDHLVDNFFLPRIKYCPYTIEKR